MRRLLGSNPYLAIPPTDFEFFKGGPADRVETRADLVDRLGRTLEHPKVGSWGLSRERALAAAEACEVSERGLFRLLLDEYRRVKDRPRAGWKTPQFEFQLEQFDRWFGDGYRFVHMVRHPLDTYASNRWYGGQEREVYTEGWANQWARSASIALRRSFTHPERHRLVRYEDLIEGTEAVLRRLCTFLDLAPEIDRMLSMADFEERDNSSFRGSAGVYEGEVRRRDDADRRGRLGSAEADTVRRICGTCAHLLGYDLAATAPVGPAERAAADLDELPVMQAFRAMAGYGLQRLRMAARRLAARQR